MAERTPGPWEVAPDRWWIVRSIQDKNTIVTAGVAGRSKEETLANVRFIAGGPDLLEVLSIFVDCYPAQIEPLKQRARHLIAKVTGETDA